MKVTFYGRKPYDEIWFKPLSEEYGVDVHFVDAALNEETLVLAQGSQAVCIFVNDPVNATMIDKMHTMGIKAILLRCAGYNHVDLKAAKGKVEVLRVPSYSPDAVAEYAMGLFLCINRNIHRAYIRSRDFNMNINGLMGSDLSGKVAGVVGTGKIGQSMIRILKGFNMKILAYDPYPVQGLDVEYVSMEELVKQADVITLHCPLTSDTKHLINKQTIGLMKKNVYLINTSRGALIHTDDLIDALLDKKFAGVALDVYEEEEGLFYEDRSNEIIRDDNLARLMTFPNVMVTSHMGFFTQEAMEAIARKYLSQLQKRASVREIRLKFPEELPGQLALRCREQGGARALRRLVQVEVEGPLAAFLLENGRKNVCIRALEADGRIVFEQEKQ